MQSKGRTALRALGLGLVFLLILSTGRGEGGEEKPLAPTAFQVAQSALEHWRDEAHREKMVIVWPDSVPAMPDAAEVHLIRGYIGYTCTLFKWEGDAVGVQELRMERSWFYNPKGESFRSESFGIGPEDFKRAWHAAQLLLGARTEHKEPPPEPEPIGERDGALIYKISCSISSSGGSHEPHIWVRMREDDSGPPLYWRTVRGTKRTDGIQDFEQLRNRALFKVFHDLAKGRTGKPEPLATWAPFMRKELAQATSNLTLEYRHPHRLLGETCLRVLGESGYADAASAIKALKARLSREDEDDWTVKRLRGEAERALVKIQFINDWNAEEAVTLLRDNPRRLYAQTDLRKWIRRRFHAREPQVYYRQLLLDVEERPEDVRLLRESIAELRERYLERSRTVVHGLLKHANAEVCADAAFALLELDGNDADALKALDELAADPEAGIDPHRHWFSLFARDKALRYLISDKTPPEYRWGAAKVRRQLGKANEDGRMVRRMIGAAKIVGGPLTEPEERDAYRRVLAGRHNRGVLVASKALMELKDLESAPRIQEVLAELRAGCNKSYKSQRDPDAKYPWTDEHELERLENRLAALLGDHPEDSGKR